MYLNKAIIIGNLTRDPEMRALPSGMGVCSFGVATNRVWKDKEGNKKEQADFHNIVVFGRQAETCSQYLKKGQSVLVEGRIQNRSWDDKVSGEKKYKTEIVADRVQFGPKSSGLARINADGQTTQINADADQRESASNQRKSASSEGGIEYPTDEINPEDIPF
ncbi:MAG: single-stranded DNA-binding protein [Candidatus Taylorbacteria bacterium]|nr:single-stranded DNA-binding protein [Candidatus Taylorbacteria bacterium]